MLATRARRRLTRPFVAEANFQIQVLSSLFFRNQTAYAVGRLVNGSAMYPFVAAISDILAIVIYMTVALSLLNAA